MALLIFADLLAAIVAANHQSTIASGPQRMVATFRQLRDAGSLADTDRALLCELCLFLEVWDFAGAGAEATAELAVQVAGAGVLRLADLA